jgi:hypothetical protein
MKIANVNATRRNSGEQNKQEPRNVRTIKNPHIEAL